MASIIRILALQGAEMKPLAKRLLNGKEPLLRQIVFDVRYHYGYNYLDRSGKILNRVSQQHDEWVIGNQVNAQNATLYSMKNGCRSVINPFSCSLSIDRINSENILVEEDIDDFAIQSEEMLSVVSDELGLTEFSRIGFRAWYYFPCDTAIDADIWIRDLGILGLAPDLTSTYGGDLESMSLAVVIAGQDHRIRIGFDSVEMSAHVHTGPEIISIKASKLREGQKDFLRKQLKERRRLEINAKYAAVIDFDAFHDDPVSIEPRDFIINSGSLFIDKLSDVISSVKRKAFKKR
jgi:hypothetical protein